ncbi:MAG: hypothetical protein JW801_06595 [Bacteroidales bacterium]|nr:hypothetical protein [Bacteroidales bacterium]
MLLDGSIPDMPPHFELVFQLEKMMFDMDWQTVRQGTYRSAQQRQDAIENFYNDVCLRLIEEFQWAAVPALCYEPGVDEFHSIRNLKKSLDDKALVFTFSEKGVFWMPTGEEMMDFIITLFERPSEMHAQARKKCDTAKELSKKQVDAGVDFIIQNTDFGYNNGPFISPKHFREFVIPYMTEITEYIHHLGIPVILHSDGDLREILDQIYSTGIDGYHSVDPQGHMDIKSVRQQYPDWLLMGNVACNLLQNTDETLIRDSVDYCMTYGGIGKKYVFSTSNCIFAGMPPQSYLIMLDEYKILSRRDEGSIA